MADEHVSQKITKYFEQYPQKKYAKGHIFIHAGDQPERILYLVKGKIRQYDISYRGDEVVVNVFKPGAFLPMLWALTDTPNQYFFDAETDVVVRVAPREEVVEFLRQNPEVTFDLLTRVYIGLNGLLGRMVQLMSGSARSRLIHEVLVECKRFGNEQQDGGYIVAVTEGDIAARAGLTRETVSREIKKLSKLGLMEMTHRGIAVRDIVLLESEINS
jgi:CRP-like cAMP-binding protein